MPDFAKCLRDVKENTTSLFALDVFLREEEQDVRSSSITTTKTRLLIGDNVIFFQKNNIAWHLSIFQRASLDNTEGLYFSGSLHPSFFGIILIFSLSRFSAFQIQWINWLELKRQFFEQQATDKISARRRINFQLS